MWNQRSKTDNSRPDPISWLPLGRTMRPAIVLALFITMSVTACHPLYGFIESEFELAVDSRLPRWFTVPPGYTREGVGMTITLYSHPLFQKVKMVVHDLGPEHKKLMKKIGTERWHPCTERQFEEQKTGAVYPNYSIIIVDGIEEIFEQRERGDILYITDDPQLRRTLNKC